MMNAPFPVPQADQSAILNALGVLFQPDDVIEIRSFTKGRRRTDAGYFDGEHRQALERPEAQESRIHSAIIAALGGGIKASLITAEVVSLRVSPRQKGSIDGTLAGLIAFAGVCAVLLAGGLPT